MIQKFVGTRAHHLLSGLHVIAPVNRSLCYAGSHRSKDFRVGKLELPPEPGRLSLPIAAFAELHCALADCTCLPASASQAVAESCRCGLGIQVGDCPERGLRGIVVFLGGDHAPWSRGLVSGEIVAQLIRMPAPPVLARRT